MKKYKTRKGSIADKAVRAAAAMDREPWSVIIFTALCIGFMIACGLAYNSVVPAYQ